MGPAVRSVPLVHDAGLVEVVDVWYSSRGAEMKVYGPTNKALVLYTGESPTETPLRERLSQAVETVGFLGIASLLVDWVARTLAPAPRTSSNISLNGSLIDDPTNGPANVFPVSPGLLFFLGGLFILLLLGIRWYWQARIERST